MAHTDDKENRTVIQTAGCTAATAAASASSCATRKRALEDITDNTVADSFVNRAKQAIKRGCTEMGIRRYASLSSMSAKHAETAAAPDTRYPLKPAALASKQQMKKHSQKLRGRKHLDALRTSNTEPSSEATVILLSSEGSHEGEQTEAPTGCRAELCSSLQRTSSMRPAVTDFIELESQITLVAPSSPPLLARIDADEYLCDSSYTATSAVACATTTPHSAVQGAAQQSESVTEKEMAETYAGLADWLLSIERKHIVDLENGLARHPNLSSRMRPILVDWLMEVAADYRMHRQTLHLTVQYLDRFLTNTDLVVEPSMLQCYGTACLSIAMKAEELRVPTLSEFTEFSKDAFTRDQLRKAELDVLAALDWHLAVPTIHEFLCLMFQRASLYYPDQFGEVDPRNESVLHGWPSICPATIPRRFDEDQFLLACDYVDALLHCQESLRFRMSELAAACFYLGTSPNSLNGAMFTLCTGYSFSVIWPVIRHLKQLRAILAPGGMYSSFSATPCCGDSTRYSKNLKRIHPGEMWAFQPRHAHLLSEFEDYFYPR